MINAKNTMKGVAYTVAVLAMFTSPWGVAQESASGPQVGAPAQSAPPPSSPPPVLPQAGLPQEIAPHVGQSQELASPVGLPIEGVDSSVRANVTDQEALETEKRQAALTQAQPSSRMPTASKWGPTRNVSSYPQRFPAPAGSRLPQAAQSPTGSGRPVSSSPLRLANSWPGSAKSPRKFTFGDAPSAAFSANHSASASINSRLSGQDGGAGSSTVAPGESFTNSHLFTQRSSALFANASPFSAIHPALVGRDKKRYAVNVADARARTTRKRLTMGSSSLGTHSKAGLGDTAKYPRSHTFKAE